MALSSEALLSAFRDLGALFVENDLAVDDLQQGDISLAQTTQYLDERRAAIVQLTDPLGNHVDQKRWIGDNF